MAMRKFRGLGEQEAALLIGLRILKINGTGGRVGNRAENIDGQSILIIWHWITDELSI